MLQSDLAKGKAVAPTPGGAGTVCAARAEITLVAADLTANKLIEMAILPAGCDFVDAILDADDLDTGAAPAVTLDAGILTGTAGVADDARVCGSEIFTASNVAQAGGVARPTAKTASRIARSDTDRGIGLKIATAPATAQGGKLGLTILYRG